MLYRPLRRTYQRVFNRDAYHENLRRRELFRPFVRSGSLAFDIGAFRGHYAETFRELGARVVAVEPNPARAAEIRRHFPGITVENAAVADRPGTLTLRIGLDDQHSTVSDEWAAMHPERWSTSIEVAAVTLDELVERHGRPGFVKIDVEGFEAHVLRGLSSPVPALCFEFQAAAPDPEPFDRLDGYEFAVSTVPYELGPFGSRAAAWQQITEFRSQHPQGSGDVFARR